MSEWLITKGLRWVGGKFDGHKTKIGAFGLILTGVVSLINIIWPGTVPGIPEMTLDQVIASITGGFIALGLGGKIDKNTEAVKAQTSESQRIVTPDLAEEQLIQRQLEG